MRKLGLATEELADRFTALAALHELGHFHARQAFSHPPGYPPGWLSEFVASYLAYAYLSEHYPEDARVWQVVCTEAKRHLAPRSGVSGDFHLGTVADDYLWYLGSLQARIDEAYRQHGAALLQRLKTAWDQRADANDPSAALRQLEQASPGFGDWARTHHRD